MKHRISLSIAALLLLCGTAGAAGVNLVTNDSFEQGTLGFGSFDGWQTNLGDISTFVDSSGQTGSNYGEASDGLCTAYFGTTAGNGGSLIDQTLDTTANQTYLLSFDLANDNAGLFPINSFLITVGNVTAFSFTDSADQNYIHYQYSFDVVSNATQLQFSGSNDNSYFELDNVVVAPAPEPGTLGLCFVERWQSFPWAGSFAKSNGDR
jgi:hypothetical protein